MSAAKLIASGHWAADESTVTMTDAQEQQPDAAASAVEWKVGQLVEVQSRTWAG